MGNLFRELGRIGRKVEKTARPVVKFAARQAPKVLAAAAGTALGGPMGGILAPTLLGAVSRGKGNKMEGALHGAMTGAGYTAAAPTIAEYFGAEPDSFAGLATGLNKPSLLSQLGMQDAPVSGGGIGLFGNRGQLGLLESLSKNSSLSEGGLEKLSAFEESSPGFLEKLLRSGVPSSALEALASSLPSGRMGGSNGGESQGDIFMEAPQVSRGSDIPLEIGHEAMIKAPKSLPHEGPSALELLMSLLSGSKDSDKKLGFKPTPKKTEQKHQRYKRGGYVKGNSGGQTDDRPTKIPEGSYVINATTVSLLGDGNSNNGASKLKKLEDKFLKSGIVRDTGVGRNIKALVSDGEYTINKSVVDALGNGNNKKGAKVLDRFRDNVHAQKGVKGIVQPKSKSLGYYLGGR